MKYKRYPVLSVAGILDEAIDNYKKSFGCHLAGGVLFGIITAVIAVIFIIALAFLIVIPLSLASYSNIMGNINPSISAIALAVALVYLITVVIMSIFSLRSVFTFEISRQVYTDERIDLGKAIKLPFKRILNIITASMAYGIVMAPVIILFFGLIWMLYEYSLMSYGYLYEWFAFGSFSFVMLLVILGIMLVFGLIAYFVSVMMSLTIICCVYERLYFFKAVARSFRLVRKNIGAVYGLNISNIMVRFGVYYLVMLFINVLLSLITAVLLSFTLDEVVTVLAYVFGSINMALQTLLNFTIVPIQNIAIQHVYYNQMIRHEGYDIELNLQKAIQNYKLRVDAANAEGA